MLVELLRDNNFGAEMKLPDLDPEAEEDATSACTGSLPCSVIGNEVEPERRSERFWRSEDGDEAIVEVEVD